MKIPIIFEWLTIRFRRLLIGLFELDWDLQPRSM